MRSLVIMLAIAALIGSAAAWDYSDGIKYERPFVGYEQASDDEDGNPLEDMIGAESGAYFKSMDPNGDIVAGGVFNRLSGDNDGNPSWTETTAGFNTMHSVYANEEANSDGDPVDAEPSSATITLLQKGEAYVTSRADDTEDKKPEMEASIYTYQNLHFSGPKFVGNFDTEIEGDGDNRDDGPAVWAQFESEGNAGIVGDTVVTSFANLESAQRRAQPAMIETSDPIMAGDGEDYVDGPITYFTEADLGMASTAGVKVDEVCGAAFSGSITSWAAFEGGHGTGIIEANAGGFENHVLLHEGGVWTEGFQDPLTWEDTWVEGYNPPVNPEDYDPNLPDGYFVYW